VKPPIIVVEGPETAVRLAVADVRAAGWSIGEGFGGVADRHAKTVRVGPVVTAEDAAAALLAVLGGSGVVIAGQASRDVMDRLLDDLRHCGSVDHRVGEPPSTPDVAEESRAILARLADGWSLGEAAHDLGLSRRTADRRLAEARRAMGVERTAEAVAKAKRLGWLR
jgi:DNA-binding NarL/FixJ family response regulator